MERWTTTIRTTISLDEILVEVVVLVAVKKERALLLLGEN